MKSVMKRFLVKFDVSQKEVIQYNSLRLYIPNRVDLNSNERETQPTMAEVVYSPIEGIKEGDFLLFQHTILNNRAFIVEKNGDIITSAIPSDGSELIYGKLDNFGNLIPLFGNTIIERIYENEVSKIIITPEAYKKHEINFARCLLSYDNIPCGATVYYYKYSDYELIYNINGIEKKVIIVKRGDIVLYNKI